MACWISTPSMGTTFYCNFRFHKGDLDDLIVGLLITGEVMSAQRVRVSDREALCMTLRRLAYPNRLCDLETIFNRHSSVISSVVSKAVHQKGAPLKNCWGLIDDTARRICRPSKLQQEHYSRHKRFHRQKYQAVMCANGTICQLDGPFRGRRHDAGILKDTRLYENIVKVARGNKYVIYRDPTYPLKPLLLKPHGGARLQPYQAHFNKCMSTVRQAAEWGFGKVAADFAFVDFHKNLKVTRQRVGSIYKVATLLANCRTCQYDSQVSMYFGLEPPSLSDYLFPFN
ncbi:hypothetical protein HPB51_009514 [Rhipicephalus microplus]|uniref:DDE Tnp4 domain-containing protein n=1 Tax=Rhipicephalus microplus TaxID=6941 RepID=A0A9J6EFU4_RHIMP|nr:hypothetical protein HPB51_009514 [Rhipicephalus microplus]